MIGACVGDVIGSRWEGQKKHPKTRNFDLFTDKCRATDDTILTCAVAQTLMGNGEYVDTIRGHYLRHPNGGYGSSFKEWATGYSREGYNSFGNGSAMRVSPVAFVAKSREEVLSEAKKSADATHNHEEGVKGAQAIALATYIAWNGGSKDDIKKETKNFGYETNIILTSEHLGFNCTCQETVPQAIYAFMHSTDYESCIRDAIMMGGDSDTIAAMAGSIAHAYYKDVPQEFIDEALSRVPSDLVDTIKDFMIKYVDNSF